MHTFKKQQLQDEKYKKIFNAHHQRISTDGVSQILAQSEEAKQHPMRAGTYQGLS